MSTVPHSIHLLCAHAKQRGFVTLADGRTGILVGVDIPHAKAKVRWQGRHHIVPLGAVAELHDPPQPA